MNVEIKNITIQLGKKEVSLTPEEARKLMYALKDLMNDKTETTIINTNPLYPVCPTHPIHWPYYSPTWCSNDYTISIDNPDGIAPLGTTSCACSIKI